MKGYIWFAIGVAVGVAIGNIKPTYGTLRIDHSNPEKDIYRFDINCDLEKLQTKKRVMFKIDNNADLSQN